MTIEFTGNESLEELEAMMAEFERAEVVDELPGDSDETEAQPETKTDDTAETPVAETTAGSAPASEDAVETQGEEGVKPTGIAAKDGEHVIPYDVLERERDAKRQLQAQLDALQEKQSEWEQSQRLLRIRDKQLQKLGVAPEDLPENIQLSEEQLDALADDYPEIGTAIRGLVAKVTKIESQSTHTAQVQTAEAQSTPQSNPVLDAIEANTDLKAWRESGGEQWNKAIEFDDQLQADPQWASKPIQARFDEATRLTKAHFEQQQKQLKDAANSAEQDAHDNALPSSPSEVGSTSRHTPSVQEQLLNADPQTAQAMMADMSQDDIEALLAQLS